MKAIPQLVVVVGAIAVGAAIALIIRTSEQNAVAEVVKRLNALK